MRAWIIAIALVAACKGGKDKDTATTPKAAAAAVPTVSVASVLAKDDSDRPPMLLLVDDAGTVRLAAAKTWADLDANSLTVTNKPMSLDLAREYVLKVSMGANRVDAIRDWNENPGSDLAALEDTKTRTHSADQDDPPPPPPEDMPDDGKDESGGTGTAMALDEGKMGKKDSDRAEGQYKMKTESARDQAIEQARRAGFLGWSHALGRTDHHPNADGTPSRGTDIAGFVEDGSLVERLEAMIAIAPTAKAHTLIEAIRQTDAAIAVSYNGKIRPLHLNFRLRDSANVTPSSSSWIEARVSAKNIAVEAVPDKPFEIVDLTQLGATVDKARAARDIEKGSVDVLVDADVNVQRLVDVIVALDTSGVKGIGIGGALSPEELTRRGHRIARVAFGQPNSQGDLDKKEIRTVIRGAKDKLQACYEKALQTNPALTGTVQAQFFIKPDGSVANASASGVSPDLAVCVAGVIKSLSFPKPKGGGGVQVNYPFTMRT